MSVGNLVSAGAEPDPDALILESGDTGSSAAEYLASHSKADAAFLKTVDQRLLRCSAHASDGFAWVASASELQVQNDGKPVTVLSTETMLLQRRATAWTIVHIH